MKLVWLPTARDQYLHWQETDSKLVARINDLIRDTRRSPFKGIGKPEPLKGNWKGWWSRRINREHRLIYRIDGEDLIIGRCRYHY